MFNLRRCCIGAALGLSLLACGPVQAAALPFPVNNPKFQFNTVLGSVTGWLAKDNAKIHTGFISLTPAPTRKYGFVYQTASVTLLTSRSYVLSGFYSAQGFGTGPNRVLGAEISYAGGGRANHEITTRGTVATNPRRFHWTFTPASSHGRLHFADAFVVDGTWKISNLNPAPEVDPDAGAPALALALGGLALLEERRRRAQDKESSFGPRHPGHR